MKAIVCTKYGSPDVLELTEVEKPVPKGKEADAQRCGASLNQDKLLVFLIFLWYFSTINIIYPYDNSPEI